jgi:hypothetical protein
LALSAAQPNIRSRGGGERLAFAAARMLGCAALNPTTPVTMLAVKSLLPDKGFMHALQ